MTATATPPTEGTSTRHRELGGFLRSRRERLRPEDVGLPEVGRRRTPGLRREEVATLAGVSTTWYTWLEQGREVSASPQVIASLATALRLTATERTYLASLAHPDRRPDTTPATCVPDAVVDLLTALEPWPAFVQDLRGDILAYNRVYGHLLRPLDELLENDRNCLWLAFTDPQWMAALGDHLPRVRAHLVGLHRVRLAGTSPDPTCRSLVDRLLGASDEFAELWNRHDVAAPSDYPVKHFRNPLVGDVSFEVVSLWTRPAEGTKLTAYRPLDDDTGNKIGRLLDLVSDHDSHRIYGTAACGRDNCLP